jgi:hypothetical protein
MDGAVSRLLKLQKYPKLAVRDLLKTKNIASVDSELALARLKNLVRRNAAQMALMRFPDLRRELARAILERIPLTGTGGAIVPGELRIDGRVTGTGLPSLHLLGYAPSKVIVELRDGRPVWIWNDVEAVGVGQQVHPDRSLRAA